MGEQCNQNRNWATKSAWKLEEILRSLPSWASLPVLHLLNSNQPRSDYTSSISLPGCRVDTVSHHTPAIMSAATTSVMWEKEEVSFVRNGLFFHEILLIDTRCIAIVFISSWSWFCLFHYFARTDAGLLFHQLASLSSQQTTTTTVFYTFALNFQMSRKWAPVSQRSQSALSGLLVQATQDCWSYSVLAQQM